jgi:hypothetical protein
LEPSTGRRSGIPGISLQYISLEHHAKRHHLPTLLLQIPITILARDRALETRRKSMYANVPHAAVPYGIYLGVICLEHASRCRM